MAAPEPSFWQRWTSVFTPGPPTPVDVTLPTQKLSRSLSRAGGSPHRPIVLVSCGSFNPPTYMHLRMFELAKGHLTEAGFDVLGGYISPVNDAYTKAGLASAVHRIAMAQAAVESSGSLMVDAWEASQPEYQRSLHVLQSIQERLAAALGGASAPPDGAAGQQVTTRAMLLCGEDLVDSFLKPGVWKPEQVEAIFKDHGVVCISREVEPGMTESQPAIQREGLIYVKEPFRNDISSTKIRKLLSQGRSVRYLTPDPVLHYIEEHALYKDARS